MTRSQGAPHSEGTSRRTRIVQILAIVAAVMLVLVTVVGCAKYDGDEQAFCDRLTEVPSFADLSEKVNTGSPEQAADQMHEAAKTFRSLERVAPRSIRQDVAALGDSADRIAGRIETRAAQGPRVLTWQQDDGTVVTIPVQSSVSQDRLGAFLTEFNDHHGTVSAMYDLAKYARGDCGLGADGLDLGMPGYGPTGNGGFDGPEQIPPRVVVPPQNPGPVTPPRDRAPLTSTPATPVVPAPTTTP